jgi:choline-glycine betaine transporter
VLLVSLPILFVGILMSVALVKTLRQDHEAQSANVS